MSEEAYEDYLRLRAKDKMPLARFMKEHGRFPAKAAMEWHRHERQLERMGMEWDLA